MLVNGSPYYVTVCVVLFIDRCKLALLASMEAEYDEKLRYLESQHQTQLSKHIVPLLTARGMVSCYNSCWVGCYLHCYSYCYFRPFFKLHPTPQIIPSARKASSSRPARPLYGCHSNRIDFSLLSFNVL